MTMADYLDDWEERWQRCKNGGAMLKFLTPISWGDERALARLAHEIVVGTPIWYYEYSQDNEQWVPISLSFVELLSENTQKIMRDHRALLCQDPNEMVIDYASESADTPCFEEIKSLLVQSVETGEGFNSWMAEDFGHDLNLRILQVLIHLWVLNNNEYVGNEYAEKAVEAAAACAWLYGTFSGEDVYLCHELRNAARERQSLMIRNIVPTLRTLNIPEEKLPATPPQSNNEYYNRYL